MEAGFDSQSDGARACGIAKSQISEYERGIAAPSLETLGRILSAYRASPHDLADALELDEAANVRLTLQRPQDANVITSRLFREDRSFTLRHHAGGIFSLLYKEVDE